MKAYELIDRPEKWVKGCPQEGSETHCVATAMCEAYKDDWELIDSHADRLRTKIGTREVVLWNYESNWETVYNTLKELDI